MKLYLHDNDPAAPGQPHGPDGPTHCGTLDFVGDYQYQLEMKLAEIAQDYTQIMRVRTEDGREWLRNAENVFLPQEQAATA